MTWRWSLLVCLLVNALHEDIRAADAKPSDQQVMAGLVPRDLRCEYLRNPLGIDDQNPRLSWKLISPDPARRGQRQTAWQILVASSLDGLGRDHGDLWDSGKIESEQSIHNPYGGKRLQSRMWCWWKVRVWDEGGHVSVWSQPGQWSMGLLGTESWAKAKWIGLEDAGEEGIELTELQNAQWTWYPEGKPQIHAPTETRYFRRTITIPADRSIRRAMCFFAGDDQCVLYVNGTQVGISRGHPNLIGLDLARQLHVGDNVLAVAATNAHSAVTQNPAGWIATLRVELAQDPPLVITSGNSWKCSNEGPAGWEKENYDDSRWVAAMELGQPGMAPWGDPWPKKWYSEHRRLPARYLRRSFHIEKEVQRATAFVCGLGFFDLHVNGQRIGDELMNPALTGYDKRALYVTFDLTSNIRRGDNAVGIVLSNGRFFAPRIQTPVPMHSYGNPRLRCQLHLQFTDGTERTIVSDESWQITTNGPIRSSNEFDGEEYDARLEMPGWSAPDSDGASWPSAQIVDPPGGQLEAQMIEPIRVIEVLRPVRMTHPKPGIHMVDFGQAFYGVVKLKVSGPPNTRISIRTSFNVLPDGTLNYHNDRSALNTDVYTLKGDGLETWHPRFRGNATRWAQVEGFPGIPTVENFEALVTHTDHEPAGEFSCSNELVNRVYLNARWGTRMQNRSVPMEPDRDERMPWSGHPAKTSESEGWAFNVARFYEHFLHNYRAHQEDDGSLQEILPPYWTFNSKDIIWPSVVTIIPDWYYNFYGDDRLLRDNYELMKRFVLYHQRTNLKADFTMDQCNYGDWVDTASIGANSRNQGATSRPLMGTAYFHNNCRIVERAARLIGRTEDEKVFGELADKVQHGFHQRFFDPDTNTYESKTQCASVLPLAFGLVPDQNRPSVIRNLVDDIMVRHNGHTSVGLIGTQWQMQVLTDIGHPEVGYTIATRTDRPSWGYMISKGATTSWERWDTDTQDGGMNGESQKILSGNFEAWCYQTLGGINYDPERPGFKHIILHPRVVGDLKWVKASHNSMYGVIRSHWSRLDDRFDWQFTVPPNTTATVYVPTDDPAGIQEGSRPAVDATGVRLVRQERGFVVFTVGSGRYAFTSPLKLHLQTPN
jgi:alpha-L-rhamnosidase